MRLQIMTDPQVVSEPVVLDFETDLGDVLKKHGFNPKLSRFLIRNLDNFRESQQEQAHDNSSNESTMGSTSEASGNN